MSARRTVLLAGERLAALGGRSDAVVTLIIVPVCELIAGCSQLARASSLGAGEASRYAACLALLLNRGARALETVPEYAGSGPDVLRASERLVATHVLALAYTPWTLQGASPATARSRVPPRPLLRWWAAAAGALEALRREHALPLAGRQARAAVR